MSIQNHDDMFQKLATFLVNCLNYILYKQSCHTIDFVWHLSAHVVYMVCHNLNL